MTFPVQPVPSLEDPGTTVIHSNSTITSSGSQVVSGFGSKEVSVIVNVTAAPTGTLVFTLQEVDPGNLTTVFGPTSSTSSINSAGVYTATLRSTVGGSIKVSWTVGGTLPSFSGVYSTVTTKVGTNTTTDGAITVTLNPVDTQNVLVSNFPATQPVSAAALPLPTGAATSANQTTLGTQTTKINDGTNTAAVSASNALKVDGSAVTQPISAAALPLPTGAATAAKQPAIGTAGTPSADVLTVQGSTSMTALKVDGSAVTQPVSGSVSVSNFPATQPISATALPLPTGAATSALQTTGNSSLSSIDTKLTGAATAAKQPAIGTAGTPSADVLTVQGSTSMTALKVDGSATTQPVSGSVTVSNFPATQPVSAAALPLPTGAATSANQTTLGSQTTKINDGTNTAAVTASNALKVDGSAVTQPVSGSVTVSGTVTATNPSVGAIGATLPSSGTLFSGTDGTNLQSTRVFDTDTGAGAQYVLGAVLRKSASGGSVEAGTSTDPLRVDPTGTTTQPISATALPLPTGAATSANQTTLGSQTTKINDGTNTAAVSASNALKVDGSAVTQPISATALPLPTGAATAAKQPAIGTAGTPSADVLTVQGSASMTALKVDGSAVTQPVSGSVSVSNFPATQPISAAALPLPTGAATSANQTTLGSQTTKINDGTNTAAVSASNALKVDGSAVTQPISATALPLPTGAATAAKQPAIGTAGTPSADVLTVQGSTSMTALKVDGSAVTQPISATALPLPTGAATSALQTTGNSSLSSLDTKTPALGQTTMAGSTPVTIASNQTAVPISATSLPLPTGAALDATLTGGTQKAIVRSAAKGVTTAADVTSTAASADRQSLDVQIRTSSGVAVDTFGGGQQYADGTARGTATGTLLMVDDGTNVQSASGDTNGRLNVNGRVTDGTNTATVKPASTAAVASDTALVVALSPNNPVTVAPSAAATSSVTSVAASVTSVELIALNASRKGATIFNDSSSILWVKFGTAASSTSFTVRLLANGYYEVPFTYTGTIHGAWNTATGNARLTELS